MTTGGPPLNHALSSLRPLRPAPRWPRDASASSWDGVRVMHAREAVPDNWESLGTPHSNTTIDLFVALKAHNENALIDALYEVSTPGHPKYGLSNTPRACSLLVRTPWGAVLLHLDDTRRQLGDGRQCARLTS
jgi:hypothetical protein